MNEVIKTEIENCKKMRATAKNPVAMYAASMKWKALCDTLHALGLSVAHFE